MVIGCVIICAFIGSSVAYDNKKEYETTWGNQDFTVPEKITEIVVLLQGAGGKSGSSPSAQAYYDVPFFGVGES